MTTRPPDSFEPPEKPKAAPSQRSDSGCPADGPADHGPADHGPPDHVPAGHGPAESPSGEASGGDGLGADEEALRRLLRHSVRDIEPSADALRALQDAVPARRRHRRRLLTAATTVAVLAVGTPVTLQAASLGSSAPHAVEAGHNQQADGSTGMSGGNDGPGTQATGGSEELEPGDSGDTDTEESPAPDDSVSSGPPDPDDEEMLPASYPRCDREQLGGAATEIDPADEDGLIYGIIRVTNVSPNACRVGGADELTVTPIGIADGDDVTTPQVVSRTEGDRATALPLPELWLDELVLPSGEGYEVRFAWVPKRGVEAGGCDVPASPEPPPGDGVSGVSGTGTTTTTGDGGIGTETELTESPDDGGAGTGGGMGGSGTAGGTEGDGSTGGDSGGEPEGPGEDLGEPAPQGVTVRYTPAAGAPRIARFELLGVCSGSLYRTGVLNIPAPAP